MRTTLDLDERVLAAARAKAAGEGISLGRAVSEIALQGLRGHTEASPGFPMLPSVDGHVITDELVDEYRDDNS